MFVLVTCCRQFDLHLLSLSTGFISTLQYLFIQFAVKQYQYRYPCESFISANANHILPSCLSVQIPLPYRLMDIKNALHWLTHILTKSITFSQEQCMQIKYTSLSTNVAYWKFNLAYICPEFENGFDFEALMTSFRRYFQLKDGHRPFNETSVCINFYYSQNMQHPQNFANYITGTLFHIIYLLSEFALIMRQLLRHSCEACSPTVDCRRAAAAAAVRESSIYSAA